MPYEVTATKKRPQEFESLVGQEFVVSTLENAIKDGKIAHAYLFSGPRGVGKTSSARLLAKALNCQEGPTAHPCGVCDSCREISNGSSVDVIEIDGASNTSVNDVRTIKEEILFPPQFSRKKIYIIDEVHMLSTSAFNALLKTIEEPPEYTVFIFATTELQKVPATIRSRCQQFRFQLIPQELIKSKLREASGESGIEAEDDALSWISKEASGSMRDAYTLFDQIASFSEGKITLEKIEEKLNLAGFDKISELVGYSITGHTDKALEALEALFSAGVSPEEIVKETADFFRTIMMWKSGIRKEDILLNPMHESAKNIADCLESDQVEGALKGALNLYRDIRYSLSPRFELELFVSRLSSLPYLSSPDRIIKEIKAIKEDISSGKDVIKKKEIMRPKLEITTSQGNKNEDIEAPSSISEETQEILEESKDKSESLAHQEESDTARSDEPMILMYETEEETHREKSDINKESGKEYMPLSSLLIPKLIDSLKEGGIDLEMPLKRSNRISELEDKIVFYTKDAYSRDILRKNANPIKTHIRELTGIDKEFDAETEVAPEKEISEKMKMLLSVMGGTVTVDEEAKPREKEKDEEVEEIAELEEGNLED